MNYPVVFGKYLLVDGVNVGGMAEVFKGKTFGVQGFERILAIKRILPNMAEDEEFINMFVDEARIAVQLSHSNIVQIYELGKFNEQYYIAMEYVSGRDLRQILDFFKKTKVLVPQNAACYIISKICEGLDYAHRKNDPSGKPLNFIHRDVSPQNILLSFDGDIKITDFGIAKAEDRASKTQAGVLKGKFGYMSPEQVRGLVIDRRSDIFAVGILLYEMVTGERLFLSESDFSTLEKVRNADVTPPSQINPDLSPELEAVVMKALAKERDDRYAWASDLQDDLQQFLIQDNSIFSSKDLAGLMHQHYEKQIADEMQKMEQYQKMNAPDNLESTGANYQPPPTNNTASVEVENNSDKTVIFESGLIDFANAATRVGDVDSLLQTNPKESAAEEQTGAQPAPIPVDHSAAASLVDEPRSLETIKKQQKRYGMLMISITAFISLIVLLLVLVPLPGQETGTIIVTSTPSSPVEIVLDGEVIGTETPLTEYDIPVGEHTLVIRSSGYTEQAFRFELAEQSPALINADLKKADGAAAGGGGVNVEIISSPSGAEVFIGGLPQGKTPLTLSQKDANEALLVTLTKTGFADETFSIRFDEKDRSSGSKLIKAELKSLGDEKQKDAEEPEPVGNLLIQSSPSRATIVINGVRKGVTPLKIESLSTKKVYNIEVMKSGYLRWKKNIKLYPNETLRLETNLSKKQPAYAGNTAPQQSTATTSTESTPAVTSSSAKGSCTGSGAKLSVMPVGVANCEVFLSGASLGIAPFFKIKSPIGKCELQVNCPDGSRYTKQLSLKDGDYQKIIIRKPEWQN